MLIHSFNIEPCRFRGICVNQYHENVKEKLLIIKPFPTLAGLDRPAGRRPDPGEDATAPYGGRRPPRIHGDRRSAWSGRAFACTLRSSFRPHNGVLRKLSRNRLISPFLNTLKRQSEKKSQEFLIC